MEALDLSKHSPEAFEGKLVAINGTAYLIGPHIATGGERIVHALLNKQTAVQHFVIKIPRFRRSAPEYAGREYTELKVLVVNKLAPRVDPNIQQELMLPEENYEIDGGFISIQENLGRGHDAFADKLEIARTFKQSGNYDQLMACLTEILAANPLHTLAMAESAQCLIRSGKPHIALPMTLKAISWEPNDRRLYHAAARAARAMHAFELAISILDRTLQRHPIDLASLMFKVELALQGDLPEVVEAMMMETAPLLNDDDWKAVRKPLEEAKKRRAQSDLMLRDVLKQQEAGDWGAAEKLAERVQEVTQNFNLAVLNQLVCRLHLGEYGRVLQGGFLINPLQGSMRVHCIVLVMVAERMLGRFEASAEMAYLLATECQEYSVADLPGIPRAISKDSTLTSRDSFRTVTTSLAEAVYYLEGPKAEAVSSLLARYRSRLM